MAGTREDAAGVGAVGPGERSVVRSLPGLRWWGAVLLAGVLTGAGLTIDMLASGEIGVVFTASFAGGCILATAWARRDSLFVPLVQPPLLLAIGVPVVVAATGSLPRSGGVASTLLAVGGPLVNAFPTLAITTAICLALGFVRSRVEPWRRAGDDLDPDARPDPRDRPPKDRPPQDRPPQDRPGKERPPKDRPPRDRDPRDRDRERPRRVRVETRPARDEGRRPVDGRARPVRPDDPDDEFGPGVRRVPRRVDGPDGPR